MACSQTISCQRAGRRTCRSALDKDAQLEGTRETAGRGWEAKADKLAAGGAGGCQPAGCWSVEQKRGQWAAPQRHRLPPAVVFSLSYAPRDEENSGWLVSNFRFGESIDDLAPQRHK